MGCRDDAVHVLFAHTRDAVTNRERFDAFAEVSDSCWLWNHSLTQNGYGRFWADGRMWLAHRWIYEQEVGPIAEGLQVDHLCRVRNCVNPAHLEAVTASENTVRSDLSQRRRTHCRRCGWELEFRPWDGKRFCRNCQRASQRRYDAKLRHAREALAGDAE